MNIEIMRAFVEIRQLALKQTDLKEQLDEIRQRIGEHDMQLSSITMLLKNFRTKTQRRGNGAKEKGSDLKYKVISLNPATRMII